MTAYRIVLVFVLGIGSGWLDSGALCDEPAGNQISEDDVNAAIDRGISYLWRNQDRQTGRWNEKPTYPGGISALCTLALLNCGVPLDDPGMKQALAYVRRTKSTVRKTYCVALETMVLCAASPEKDRLQIRNNVKWLQRNQIPDGPHRGSWSYGKLTSHKGDPSNTQFALLALHEAERVGIQVQPTIWRRSLAYWTRLQRRDGSWSYDESFPSSGSMTCAGITSTIIALGQRTHGDARVDGNQVLCCQPQADESIPERGLEWLAQNFSVSNNPMARAGKTSFVQIYYFYYLYGVERVGRMTANRFIGEHDWYREGAAKLLAIQDRTSGAWIGSGVEKPEPAVTTAMALLFLSKGRRPVVIAKYNSGTGDDWNRHRSDLNHLTRYVEQRWRRDLTWQVIDGSIATVEDLLQAPVLYISGRDQLNLRPDQKLALKQYVDQGGFIFAESCCDGGEFEQDFFQLTKELFPESPLRLLPPDHPIWFAEQRVAPELVRELYGIDACCRTSVVYCPGRLSCYWELGGAERNSELPETVSNEVVASLAMGANVLTYATNRELKAKLDVPLVLKPKEADEPNARGTLYVAKVLHNGGSDDAPAALANLLELAAQNLQMRVSREKRLVSLLAENIYDYPLLFVHGRRDFRWTPAERKALAEFTQRGGVVIADAICASEEFADAFRRELRAIYPDHPLQRLPTDHPLLTTQFQGYDLSQVQLRNPQVRASNDVPMEARIERVPPNLEAIEVDGRLVVVFSPFDLSCALENQTSIECRGYVREDAAKIGINCLLYAMGQ